MQLYAGDGAVICKFQSGGQVCVSNCGLSLNLTKRMSSAILSLLCTSCTADTSIAYVTIMSFLAVLWLAVQHYWRKHYRAKWNILMLLIPAGGEWVWCMRLQQLVLHLLHCEEVAPEVTFLQQLHHYHHLEQGRKWCHVMSHYKRCHVMSRSKK